MTSEDKGHWKGALYFSLQIHSIFFNEPGKYLVKFGINSSRGDLHKVKLFLGDSEKSIYEHEYISEPLYQEDTDIPCQLDDTQFKFQLPEEFSEGEVHLFFETYQFPDNLQMEPFKYGEGQFLIFPYAAPMQNEPSTSTDKLKCYHFTTQVTINDFLEEEQVYINTAQIHTTVLLEIEDEQGRTISRRSVTLLKSDVVYPVSKDIIFEEEEHLNDLDENYDARFSCLGPSFQRNSFSIDAASFSESNSVSAHPDSNRATHLQLKESPQFTFLCENDSESNEGHQSVSTPVSHEAELETQTFPVQHHEKPTLSEANNKSHFTKAWTNKADWPPEGDTLGTLPNWNNSQVDSSVGTEKIKGCIACDSAEGQTGRTGRKSFNQAEMSRNMSVSSRKMVKDPALSNTSQGPSNDHLCGSHLNEAGSYEVVVIVHSACDLPSNSQGRPPQPYVTGKTTDDEQGSGLSQCATHATFHPTYSPLWEELLVVKVSKENFETQELILCVVDHPNKTLITTFKLPLQPLKPFYPCHIELEQVESDTKPKLFITLMYKTDELSLPSLHSEIFGLEVVLRHITTPLADNCAEQLMAAVRIVSSFTQYRQTYLDGKPRQACIKIKKVKYPSSELAANLVSICKEDQYGIPQITFAGEPSEQPKWNQMFFFHGDDRSLFSRFSTLVIEYFSASQVVSFGCWQPRFPIGFSFHNLDHSLLTDLQRDNATMGIRIKNIAIKDSPLRNKTGEAVTVNVILRLVTKKRPDLMLSPSHYGILPQIDMAITKSPGFPTDIPLSGTDNISDAVKEPLPDAPSINRTFMPLPMINQLAVNQMRDPAPRRSDPPTEPTGPSGFVDPSVFSVMERQTKEIEKHRYAMKKMADDIIQLKSEATRLQAANSRLRLELHHRSENNNLLSLPSHFENTTHAELVQRIVIVKGSLDEQTAINRELKLEIQSLQNQLIKKNEREKEFYKLQDVHKNQQVLLQKMQERLRKTKTLEETCKKQEKVIIRLEDFLANSDLKEKNKKGEEDKTINEALSEENKRLRSQLLNYERTGQAVSELDRFQLHDKLKRAEGRVEALEKELLENTRRWARDKAELQLKLSDTQISQQSSPWHYPNIAQEPLNLFDRTPPASRNFQTHSRRASPRLSPLSKK